MRFDPTKPAPPVTIMIFFMKNLAWQRPTLPCLKTKYHRRRKATSEFGMGSGITLSQKLPGESLIIYLLVKSNTKIFNLN